MPVLQTTLHGLNTSFGPDHIGTTAQTSKFTSKDSFHSDLADHGAAAGTDLHRYLREHLRNMPGAMAESVRAAIRHALDTSPPTNVTFAWAPGYDWEVTIWQAPDTDKTKGGVTIMIKSRYPDHAHPLKK